MFKFFVPNLHMILNRWLNCTEPKCMDQMRRLYSNSYDLMNMAWWQIQREYNKSKEGRL